MEPDLLSCGNLKYRKRWGSKLLTFGLPSVKTCPNAGACASGCYARQGHYIMAPVRNKEEQRHKATLLPQFHQRMTDEIDRRKPKIVRVHDSGDFYEKLYLLQWLIVGYACPNVTFFAYTKMVSMVRDARAKKLIPKNWHFVFSEGGIEDKLIRLADLQARVFETQAAISRSKGYVNASKDDISLILKGHKKLGLVYHGWKSKAFHTGGGK